MNRLLRNYLGDESGAVTVDWVLLTAALVTLAISVLAMVGTSAQSNADKLSTHLDQRTVATY